MRTALRLMRAIGSHLGESAFLLYIADCLCEAGRPEEGLAVIAETREFVERTGELYRRPDVDRIHGKLLLKLAPPSDRIIAEAEQRFLSAIEIARSFHVRSFELRAAFSLARLWKTQGRIDEARGLLQPIYASFTEGMNTPFLRHTQALLESMALA
jgi:predicted ATPase